MNFLFTLLTVAFCLWALAIVFLFTRPKDRRYCKKMDRFCQNKKCKECKVNG